MFAYVDETGNTGSHLLDEEQPLFITGALLTRGDFDERFAMELAKIAQATGADQIHAAKLGVGRLEQIAPDILKLLRKAGPAFALARVEKRYVSASKVFDTLFDSFENKAVPWHIYNIAPLRLTMMFKLAALLDEDNVSRFWAALMEPNSAKAQVAMAAFCREVLERVDWLPDERSRQIIGDGLIWAAGNPESLQFVHADKITRKGHVPNMVGFGNLLAGIEEQSVVWKRPVDLIKHDRQNEFSAAIETWHHMYSNALPGAVTLPFGRKFVLRKVFGSRLQMTSAVESPGIQMIDVILWLFARALRQDLPEKCQRLLNYVYSRAFQDDFSFAGVGADVESLITAIERQPMPAQAMADARRLQAELEERRQAAMAEYAQGKLEALSSSC